MHYLACPNHRRYALAAMPGSAAALLINSGRGKLLRNCYAGQPHTGYIDHVLLRTAVLFRHRHLAP